MMIVWTLPKAVVTNSILNALVATIRNLIVKPSTQFVHDVLQDFTLYLEPRIKTVISIFGKFFTCYL